MIVKKYGKQVFVTKETSNEALERLGQIYGADNIHVRDFYNREYLVFARNKETGEYEEHPTSITFQQERELNRSEIRRSKAMLKRDKYGEQKTNAESRTKHMRTPRERKLAIARRKQR